MLIQSPYAARLTTPPTKRLGAAGTPPSAGDQAIISSAGVGAAEPRMSTKQLVGIGGMTALMVAGGLCGTAAALPAHTAAATTSQSASTSKSATIHYISHIDATESTIEPEAFDGIHQMEVVKQAGGSAVTSDISIDRKYEPGIKIAEEVMCVVLLGAPATIGLIAANAARRKTVAGALMLAAAGLAGSYGVGVSLDLFNATISTGQSIGEDFTRPTWSGHRTYQIDQSGHAVLQSTSNEANENASQPLANYLGQTMKKYPDGITVVHVMGHGMAYRYNGGITGTDFTSALKRTTQQAGRPIDILLMESCLQGNLENVAANYPYAKYMIVSEEVEYTQATGQMLARTQRAVNGTNPTARELGQTMVAQSAKVEGIETLVMVDSSKVPDLLAAVDKLGGHLSDEVKAGRTAPIQKAMESVPEYPKPGFWDKDMRKTLGLGDLQSLARNLQREYPANSAIHQDAQAVLDRMDAAIVARQTKPNYKDSGGLSIQLPGGYEHAWYYDKDCSKFANSAAPPHWRQFVEAMQN